MPLDLLKFLTYGADLTAITGCFYLVIATRFVVRFVTASPRVSPGDRPVTVLRPLHGLDPGLHENLQSCVDQRYPVFELVCGVQDPADPAIVIVDQLKRERPDPVITLVIDATSHGRNFKVANLVNMLRAARHDCLVMIDSDMRTPPEFLATVSGLLADPTAGLVTSLYRGRAADEGLWSRLGAQYINYAFLPQAVVGERLRPGRGCFGASIAMSRETLEAMGGLAAIADTLADDNALGVGVRSLGKRVVVSPIILDNWLAEPSFGALFRHELRWLLTIRSVAPRGHFGLLLTHPLPLALFGVLTGGLAPIPLGVLAIALLARFGMVRAIDRVLGLAPSGPWLFAGRDLISFAVYVASFCTRTVTWRDRHFHVSRQGRLSADGDRPP